MRETAHLMQTKIRTRLSADPRLPRRRSLEVFNFSRDVVDDPLERVAWMDAGGELFEVENIHAAPENSWSISPSDWRQVIASAVLLVHSHPNGSQIPSRQDLETQIAMGIPWAICPRGADPFFLGLPGPWPILGRGYRFGVDDCWTCFRLAFKDFRGVELRDFARAWGFWKSAEPVFETHISEAGFERVEGGIAAAVAGDGIAFRIRSKVFNHCAFYLGAGEIIHHPSGLESYDPTRVSRREPLGRWQSLPHEVFRYVGP